MVVVGARILTDPKALMKERERRNIDSDDGYGSSSSSATHALNSTLSVCCPRGHSMLDSSYLAETDTPFFSFFQYLFPQREEQQFTLWCQALKEGQSLAKHCWSSHMVRKPEKEVEAVR
ncbi:hypothetical protein VNO77_25171 [Canavalia gladiata]|uniref:Uncharacterized protein n=1 Tax=Canavalia gladiata TaxID=3824 RepID=A0AAN9QDC8_CANGL